MYDTEAVRTGYSVIDKYNEVVPGYGADMVLEILPKDKMVCDPIVLGHDEDGLVVEWHYPDVIFTLEYSPSEFSSGYVVQKIEVKDVSK